MPDRDLVQEFASFHAVLDNYARHLSEEGIFLTTSERPDVGSQVAFEVRIRDGFSVLKGAGEVVQATDDGCYLRLVDLDQPSVKLLPKLLEHYRRTGVPLMELPSSAPEDEDPVPLDAEMPPDPGLAVETETAEEPGQEMSADELFAGAVESSQPSEALGLTLDDLEEEFRAAAPSDDSVTEVDVSFDVGLETEESPPEPAAVLVEAVDLADPVQLDQEALQVAEKLEPEVEVVSSDHDAGVDAGLPWLPEEPEKSGKKDFWIIVGLILLGAALGAIFYIFVIRPNAQRSWQPPPPESTPAQAVPASNPIPGATLASPQVGSTVTEEETPVILEPAQGGEDRQASSTESAMPLTGVVRITWGDEAGATVVTLWADGSFLADQVDDFRVNGEQPREVVTIRGVQRPFAEPRIELGTDHVRQIRTGLHQEDGVNSLHIVADLVDIDVELLRTETAGEQLRVYFSKTG